MAPNNAQRDELHKTIWQIANDLRGSIDGWDFKQYVLGTLFYRYISEDFNAYINEGEASFDESFNYADIDDSMIDAETRDDLIRSKGYFIYPSQLFCNVVKNAANDENLEAAKEVVKADENAEWPAYNKYVIVSPDEEAAKDMDEEEVLANSYVQLNMNKGKTWIGWISGNNGGSVSSK